MSARRENLGICMCGERTRPTESGFQWEQDVRDELRNRRRRPPGLQDDLLRSSLRSRRLSHERVDPLTVRQRASPPRVDDDPRDRSSHVTSGQSAERSGRRRVKLDRRSNTVSPISNPVCSVPRGPRPMSFRWWERIRGSSVHWNWLNVPSVDSRSDPDRRENQISHRLEIGTVRVLQKNLVLR
jgi:hypothetical protein